MQILVTGAPDDQIAQRLDRAARSVYRFGKTVLRITPATAPDALPPVLRETVPHLDAAKAQAFVCVGQTCYPPVQVPEKLLELLEKTNSEASAAAR
jgi:uncharacterized protein YyaL (SSP411 family)